MQPAGFVTVCMLASIVLCGCGSSTPTATTSSGSPPSPLPVPSIANRSGSESGGSAIADPSGMPSSAAGPLATAEALAANPTRIVELEATILAQKPTEDGCDPHMRNINAGRSTLQARWTGDGKVNLRGTLDAPSDTGFFVFVYDNGAPIYWALFDDVKPAGQRWDYTTTMPAPDDPVMGKLAQKNAYKAGDKICVGVTGLKAGLKLDDLADAAKMKDSILAELRLPVGGAPPTAIALPTVNPARGEGICPDKGDLPIAEFAQITRLASGAYADAKKGALAWEPDARLYRMEVGCALLGGLEWSFSWISDSAKQVAKNSAGRAGIKPGDEPGERYDTVGASKTIDPTAVPISVGKLGTALLGAGFDANNTVSIVSRITLTYASKDGSTTRLPDGAPAGIYYTVSIAKNADDLGSRVYVDANSGKVFK